MSKKRLLLSALVLSIASSLFALNIYSLDNIALSPFVSASYYGSFYDALYNPAALPLKRDDGTLLVSYTGSDDVIADKASINMKYFQNHADKLVLAFLGRNISLTGQFGSDFRIIDGNKYDIYNTIDAQIDWAYALPYFSFGMRLKGGNSMIRSSKEIDNLADAYANALFSPFENDLGSSRFSLSAGALLYFKFGALGAYVDKIMSLDDGAVSINMDNVLESSVLSLYLGLSRINKEGELNLVRPRLSLSYSSLKEDSLVFDIKADVAFQPLPTHSLALGVGYRESEHRMFSFKRENGLLSIYIKAEFDSFSVLAGSTFNADNFKHFTPVLALTYIN